MKLGKRQSLVGLALVALSGAAPESRLQTAQPASSMPAGPLAFRTNTARFAPDGGFEVAGAVDGMGSFRLAGSWSRNGDRLDLRGSFDEAAVKLFALIGMPKEALACPDSGTYRVGLDGA